MLVASQGRVYGAATAVYVVLAAVILLLAEASVPVDYGADASSWIEPARGFATHFAFVHPDDPDMPMSYRPPAYPLLVAVGMWLGGDEFAKVVVAIQLVLLFATAALTARMAEIVAPGYGQLAFCLLLFNPNSFGTVFFVQSETLSALFVALAALGLFRFAETGQFRTATGIGIAVAAASLTRPEARFLAVFAPLGLIVLARLNRAAIGWKQGAAAALVCFITVAAVTAPWMARNNANGDGYRLTGSGNVAYYVWNSATEIEMVQFGIPTKEAEARMAEARAAAIESFGARWHEMERPERDAAMSRAAWQRILNYEPAAIAKNVTLATVQFFTAGGAGRLFALARQPDAAPFAVMAREGESDYLRAVLSALAQGDGWILTIWIVAISYVVLARLLGLVGLYGLIRARQYAHVLIIASGLGYFALVLPFFGISRFRVAVECLLVLLVVSGVRQIWQRRHQPLSGDHWPDETPPST